MKIRRFVGKDMREALSKVKAELGGDAVIMSNKKVDGGVEIVAACDKEPVPKPAPLKPQAAAPRTASLSEIIGDSGPDSLRELLEKQVSQNVTPAPQFQAPTKHAPKITANAPAATENLTATPTQSDNNEIALIKEELSSLRQVLEFQVNGLLDQRRQRGHPLHSYFEQQFTQMGLDKSLAEELVGYLETQMTQKEAWLFLLKLLSNRLHCQGQDQIMQGGVFAFVGPTGTGKTTTVAKLAAKFAQRYGADQVGLITIDSYRIAAFEQLATYAKIIGCSVKKAANAQELSDALTQFRSRRLILIDTAGFGQRDSRLINQLDTLKQSGCATIHNYLLLQASAQREVLEETLAQYQQISLQGCIFTKLDECYSLGQVISAAIAARLPVSYITDGQSVPEDIHSADAKQLVASAARLFKRHARRHAEPQVRAAGY